MSQVGARSASAARETTTGRVSRRGLTPAQWYCLLIGLALLLAGAFGFLADASFDTSGTADGDRTGNADGQLQGDGFLGFEVNAWHNIVHLLSGLVLLAAFRRRGSAKAVALAFGAVYGLVALIGLIDGSDVLGIIPVNGADNVLHIALSALGILTALVSRGDEHPGEKSDTPAVDHRRHRVGDSRLQRDRVDSGSSHDAADRVRR
jgi:Domain of unknown function (DUF4383)